ncbi:sigma-70 family RNA polymerase sigma factor [bacterium]|nr:sigma-70 family RNA polymerase sigma factor [bacterium]
MKLRQRDNHNTHNTDSHQPVIIDHPSAENSELEILDRIDGNILLEELNAAVDRLEESQRICIELFYFEEKSYQEISEITRLEIKQVKSHLQNGKRNLHKMLSKTRALRNAE